MTLSISNSTTTRVWFDNDHKGNPAVSTNYHINVCYMDLSVLTAFLEYAGEHLKRYTQYESLFTIHCNNDTCGERSTGLTYSVHMETEDRNQADKFRLFWLAFQKGEKPVVERNYREDPMTPEEEAESDRRMAAIFAQALGGDATATQKPGDTDLD